MTLSIQKVLQADIVTSSAAAVFVRNTNPKITSAAQIPPYLYTCLSDLFQGTGKGASWPNYVNIKFGNEASRGDFGIDLIYQASDSVYATQNPDKSDIIGAKFAVMRTLCRLANPTSAQTNLVDQADLRVWYLIDCLCRTKWAAIHPPPISVGGTGGKIDTTTLDISLDPAKGIYCRFLQNDHQASDARSRASLYSLNYYHLVM